MPQQWTAEEIRTFLETHQAEGWIPAEKRPGRVVCVEGMDGVGKSTAIRQLILFLHRSGLFTYATHTRYFRPLSKYRRQLIQTRKATKADRQLVGHLNLSLRMSEGKELRIMTRALTSEIPSLVLLDRSFLTPVVNFLCDEIVRRKLRLEKDQVYQYLWTHRVLGLMDGQYDLPDLVLICLDKCQGVSKLRNQRDGKGSTRDPTEEPMLQRRVWELVAKICPNALVIDMAKEGAAVSLPPPILLPWNTFLPDASFIDTLYELEARPLGLEYFLWDAIDPVRRSVALGFDKAYPAFVKWRRKRAREVAISMEIRKRLVTWLASFLRRYSGHAIRGFSDTNGGMWFVQQKEAAIRWEVEQEFEERTF